MKATLEFNLPEENEEFGMKMRAGDYYCALSEFADLLRRRIKYEDLSPEVLAIYEEVRAKFFEVLKDNEVEL